MLLKHELGIFSLSSQGFEQHHGFFFRTQQEPLAKITRLKLVILPVFVYLVSLESLLKNKFNGRMDPNVDITVDF